jgi:hypothetical protein
LSLAEKIRETVFRIDFNALKLGQIQSYKVLWAIFGLFDLNRVFKITNEKKFYFLSAISQTYHNPPYHNWKHAVDVTQFISYELIVSGIEKVFTKFEIFGFLVAAICHDTNHDGFTNIFHVKCKKPFGIFFQDRNILETHHCCEAIKIIIQEKCNIFDYLNHDEEIKSWNLIFQLILAIDMSKHHVFFLK